MGHPEHRGKVKSQLTCAAYRPPRAFSDLFISSQSFFRRNCWRTAYTLKISTMATSPRTAMSMLECVIGSVVWIKDGSIRQMIVAVNNPTTLTVLTNDHQFEFWMLRMPSWICDAWDSLDVATGVAWCAASVASSKVAIVAIALSPIQSVLSAAVSIV